MWDIFRGPSGDALGQPCRRINSGAWWVHLSYLGGPGLCHQKRNQRVVTDEGPSGNVKPVP